MKKLINSLDTVGTDALAGIAAAHPSLSVDIENKVVTRASAPTAGRAGSTRVFEAWRTGAVSTVGPARTGPIVGHPRQRPRSTIPVAVP